MTEQTTTTWFDGESLGAGPGFNAWILAGPEGPVPVAAGSDLVVGSIRWLKLLDAPAGLLTDAFKIRCFHCQPAGDKLNPEPLKGLFVKHSIRIWEGPHDDRYFRVSFSSFSAPNQDDWRDEDMANGRDRNVVQLFFASGVVWKNNVFSGKGAFPLFGSISDRGALVRQRQAVRLSDGCPPWQGREPGRNDKKVP